MRLRCRSSAGTHTISGLEDGATLGDLREKVALATGLVTLDSAQVALDIKFGSPPKMAEASSTPGDVTLASLGIQDGEAIQVVVVSSSALTSSTSTSTTSVPTMASTQRTQVCPTLGPSGLSSASNNGSRSSMVGVALSDGSQLVKRVIISDNSCLFNAVGYVMEHDRNKASKLRQVVADTVASDPETYNEVFLEKSNGEYCKWILNPQRWGGAIELSILAKYYGREICAHDIQTKRCDVYGQGCYSERVMVIYDGLHYDALALSAFAGAPEEIDITVFEVTSPTSEQASLAAKELVQKLHEAKQFTDTANFTLRCTVCQKGLTGEKQAQEHAKITGHFNFAEY